MAVREIYTSEHPVLRQKAKKVKHVDAAIHKLIDDMIESMRAARGLGLAAPQIGVSLRVLVIELPEDEEADEAVQALPPGKRQVKYSGNQVVLINPEILRMEGEQSGEEGCLSIPGYVGIVRRAEKIVVKGLNRKGKDIRIKANGLLARALQHEVDHLDGILYTDRIENPGDLFRLTEDNERVPVFQGGAKQHKQLTPA